MTTTNVSRMDTDLQRLGLRLVGQWTTEATHPALPGPVISGSAQVEWLEGKKFLIYRTQYDHPDLPDAISIIGDTDGLQMHYFDTRGVHRVYELSVTDDGWVMSMDRNSPARSFASSDAPFSQRMTYTFDHADQKMSGQGQLSHDDVTWEDDLTITCRRA
jgi:hypothetical protein